MNLLDLFSGIGAFSLGLERSGAYRTVAFCEVDPFCRRVLAEHWPEVPCYDDVRSLTAERLRADGISVDAICGGFPCQDISVAGRGAGIGGERSGLWSEFARIIGELRPRYVFVENVAALLGRGLGTVLGDLAALGFDAEWHCIPAAAVGAPHRRDRIWIVAYAESERERPGRCEPAEDAGCRQLVAGTEPWRHTDDRGEAMAHAEGCGGQGVGQEPDAGRTLVGAWIGAGGGTERRHSAARGGDAGRDPLTSSPRDVADAHRPRLEGRQRAVLSERAREWIAGARGPSGVGSVWFTEPDVGRVAHGVPARMDRLRALGNALVPQIAELIGRAVAAAQHRRTAA